MAHDRSDVAELTATIDALRDELDHLRRAMYLRALIEQAKGVLMAQKSIGPQAAFERLREISQAQNARLVDVAATLVGATLPTDDGLDLDDSALPPRLRPSSTTSPEWRTLRAQSTVRQGTAGAVLETLAEGLQDGEESASLVLEFLSPLGVSSVALWRSRADSSVEMVGQVGYAADTSSAWRRLPVSLDAPVTRAIRTSEPVFCESSRAVVEQFPLVTDAIRSDESVAAIPVVGHAQAVGAVVMSWQGDHPFDAQERRRVTDLASRIGRAVLRDVAVRDPDWEYLTEMLGIVLDPWLMLHAIEDGAAGLVIEAAGPDVPEATEHVGDRLLATYPSIAADTDAMADLGRLMRDGGRLSWQTRGRGSAPWDAVPSTARAVRLGERVIIAWHPDDVPEQNGPVQTPAAP